MPKSSKSPTGKLCDSTPETVRIHRIATGKRPVPGGDEAGNAGCDMVYVGNPNGLPRDEDALKALAREIHGCIGTAPNMAPDVIQAAKIVADSVLAGASTAPEMSQELQDIEADQQKWLAGLTTTVAGQKLMDHLQHMEAAPYMKPSSAFEQAASFRRVLIHALSKKPNPFGLPKKLPKYMAVVNFSGERMFMYSENACLIAFLTMGSEGTHPASPGVQKILDHAVSTPDCNVLLCYSLPFQSGIESAYWEVRTLVRTSGNHIEDSYLVCSSWDKQASKGTSTLAAESQRTDILDQQEAAYASNMMACDLDVLIEPVDGVDPGMVFDERNAKLLKMVTMLQNERRKMIEEHRVEMEEIKSTHELDCQKAVTAVDHGLRKQAQQEDQMRERMDQAEVEVRMMRSVIKQKEDELQQFKADEMLKQETIKAEKVGAERRVGELEQQFDKLQTQLKSRDKDKEQALSKQAQAHRSIQEQTERKLQAAKGDVQQVRQSIGEAERKSKKVEVAFEAVCTEKTHLISQLADMRKNSLLYKMRLNLARARGDTLQELMQKARMAHATAEEQLGVAIKKLSEHTAQSATIQEAAGAAVHETEELQKERDDLSGKVAALERELENERTVAAVATDRPVMADADTMTVPTMSKAELELGDLQTAHVKLQDELAEKQKSIDQLRADLARARLRSGKKQPPASFLPDSMDSKEPSAGTGTAGNGAVVGVPANNQGGGGRRSTPQTQVNIMVPASGNAHVPPIDLGHDANGDPMLESTIQQLQMSLRTLADTARAGKKHERAAYDAFSKLQAYENMGMSAHMQQQHGYYPQGQQFAMYAPPGNGHMGY